MSVGRSVYVLCDEEDCDEAREMHGGATFLDLRYDARKAGWQFESITQPQFCPAHKVNLS